jgi:hypothetical protein
MLAGKLFMVLSHLQLGVNLLSTDLCMLLLLFGLLLNEEELHHWLGCRGLYHDRQDSLECRGFLWRQCSGDGVSQGYHVTSLGSKGSRAPPSA